MDEAYNGNHLEFIMSMLLGCGQSVKLKWRELKNAKDFIRNISGVTPSTLDSCSYRFKMYLIAENMPFHALSCVF